jgi:hypothetical protein
VSGHRSRPPPPTRRQQVVIGGSAALLTVASLGAITAAGFPQPIPLPPPPVVAAPAGNWEGGPLAAPTVAPEVPAIALRAPLPPSKPSRSVPVPPRTVTATPEPAQPVVEPAPPAVTQPAAPPALPPIVEEPMPPVAAVPEDLPEIDDDDEDDR